MTIISQQIQRGCICVCTCLRTHIITRIAKWVSQKAAYRAGIRDEVENKPLRQYRDPSLQIAYVFGRVEVRDNHWQRDRAGSLITGIRKHWYTILLYVVVSLLIGVLIAYIDPHIGTTDPLW